MVAETLHLEAMEVAAAVLLALRVPEQAGRETTAPLTAAAAVVPVVPVVPEAVEVMVVLDCNHQLQVHLCITQAAAAASPLAAQVD